MDALYSVRLGERFSWTAGTIYENGEPVLNHGAYLSSTWATPVIGLGGEALECWVYEDDLPEDKQGHLWTESALALLKAREAKGEE